MENKKHTPLPWEMKPSESKPAFNIVGTILGGKYKIARCPYLAIPNTIAVEKEKEEAKANAEFIVNAVNSHSELIEALEHCKKVFLSLADRGLYPLELLEGEKEFLGKHGLIFITKTIENATKQ